MPNKNTPKNIDVSNGSPTNWYQSILTTILLSASSGWLLVLSFPKHNIGWLVWVALVPLLVSLSDKRPKSAFFTAYLCGLVFFPGIFDWILGISGYSPLHHIILALYLGGYFGVFGLIFSIVNKKTGIIQALFTAPFVWISLEFIRSNFFFLALPWAMLAHSQYLYPPIIQFASWGGTYAIGALIVLVNSAIAANILFFACNLKCKPLGSCPDLIKKDLIFINLTAVLFLILCLTYGYSIIMKRDANSSIKVAVVQGNIEQAKKWDRKFADSIMQIYDELTRLASKDTPDLIVWPETATPSAISRDPSLYDQVKQISRSAGAYLLLGSASHRKFSQDDSKGIEHMNSAFLIYPDNQKKYQQYDKVRLLPFGEYLPMHGKIPWSLLGIPHLRGYTPGKEFTVFDVPEFRFATTICWENIFPDLPRKFVKNGAQLIVNITNEAWFGKTSAPYQFLAMSVFRAVENRISVVRCANTGVSAFISPHGEIIGRVEQNNEDIFVPGYLTKDTALLKEMTFYTLYGDIFAYISIFITLLVCFITVIKR